MLYKTSTRWQNFLSKLSPDGYSLLENANLLRPRDRFVLGYNTAVDHIVHKYGYTPVNIAEATKAQYEQAIENISKQIAQGYINNDSVSVRRNIDALHFLKKSYSQLGKASEPQRTNSWEYARTDPNKKLVFIENMDVSDIPGDREWFKARVRGHESLEINEGERLLREFYTNPDTVINRAKLMYDKKYHDLIA